mgnify:CR=1 FL=1
MRRIGILAAVAVLTAVSTATMAFEEQKMKSEPPASAGAAKAAPSAAGGLGITPPELAPGTAAHRLNKKLARKDTRPKPEELAKLPWLSQDRAYAAGYYLLTHGLQEHAKHPEIEVCNVPGAMLPQAMRMLNVVADYVLGGTPVASGEVMILSEDPLSVVGFLGIAKGARGTDHDRPVLRVVFLR